MVALGIYAGDQLHISFTVDSQCGGAAEGVGAAEGGVGAAECQYAAGDVEDVGDANVAPKCSMLPAMPTVMPWALAIPKGMATASVRGAPMTPKAKVIVQVAATTIAKVKASAVW